MLIIKTTNFTLIPCEDFDCVMSSVIHAVFILTDQRQTLLRRSNGIVTCDSIQKNYMILILFFGEQLKQTIG